MKSIILAIAIVLITTSVDARCTLVRICDDKGKICRFIRLCDSTKSFPPPNPIPSFVHTPGGPQPPMLIQPSLVVGRCGYKLTKGVWMYFCDGG